MQVFTKIMFFITILLHGEAAEPLRIVCKTDMVSSKTTIYCLLAWFGAQASAAEPLRTVIAERTTNQFIARSVTEQNTNNCAAELLRISYQQYTVFKQS